MKSQLFASLLIVFITFEVATACPGLFGGGGGGCCGGCGGRRKRSIEESHYDGIVSNNDDMLCNSPEMKQLIVKNMRDTPTESSKALQNALEEHDLHRYVVVCSQSPFNYAIKPDTAYCGARNGTHYCQAFAL